MVIVVQVVKEVQQRYSAREGGKRVAGRVTLGVADGGKKKKTQGKTMAPPSWMAGRDPSTEQPRGGSRAPLRAGDGKKERHSVCVLVQCLNVVVRGGKFFKGKTMAGKMAAGPAE